MSGGERVGEYGGAQERVEEYEDQNRLVVQLLIAEQRREDPLIVTLDAVVGKH